MSKLQRLRRLLGVLSVLTLLFIWGNSLLPAATSSALSNWVKSILPDFGGQEGEVSTFFIRKLAHFTEYAVLGALLTWRALLGSAEERPPLRNLALMGVFAALIDETIQMTNDRSAQVRDVWIDFGGFTLGVLAVWGIITVIRHHQRIKEDGTRGRV